MSGPNWRPPAIRLGPLMRVQGASAAGPAGVATTGAVRTGSRPRPTAVSFSTNVWPGGSWPGAGLRIRR